MSYSDNLYSMRDDDSDVDPIYHPVIQAQLGQPTQYQHQESFQNAPQNSYHGGEASGSSHNYYQGQVDIEEDDLYDDDPDYLSPTDGYFRAAPETITTTTAAPSSERVPPAHTASATQTHYMPNVLVEDPSLEPGSTAESKAREADQERRANSGLLNNSVAYATDNSIYPVSTHTTYTPTSSHHGPASGTGSGLGSGSGSRYSTQATYTYRQPSSSSAYYPSSTASYTSNTPRRAAYNDSSSQQFFIPPREAPPAYTPSPTSPQSDSSVPSGTTDPPRNYNTFPPTNIAGTAGIMGRPEETEGLLARDPESMASPEDGLGANETLVWRERMRRRLPYANWRSGKILLAALAFLLVAVGFLTSLISGLKDEGGNNNNPGNSPIKLPPPTNPPMDNIPDYPDVDNGFHWGPGSHCQSNKIARPTEQFEVSFTADKSLSIAQRTSKDDQPRDGRLINVQGDVIFRRSESGSPSSSVTLQVTVSDDNINVATAWDASDQTLSVTVPSMLPWDGKASERPCVNIIATVWVPENGALNGLDVKTIQLGISLLDNLWLDVARNTRLNSTVGKIVSASTGMDARDKQIYDAGAPESFRFRSRIIEVKTTSAPISGSWPLLDYLGLISTSGDIRSIVEPKEVDKDKPSAATLYVKSTSGDVTVREPIHAAKDAFAVAQAWKQTRPDVELDFRAETVLPPRDYVVDVHTTSGIINAALAFTSGANFKSSSGNMDLDLLPVLDSSQAVESGKKAFLQTVSTSANHVVDLLEPLWVDSAQGSYVLLPPGLGVPIAPLPEPSSADVSTVAAAATALRILDSHHSLTSGDMKLHYPSAWEGELSLASNSGRLTAVGDGLRIIKSGSGFPGFNKYLLARKGDEGGSRFVAKTTSGDVLVTVGN